jgi:hypothetical protein
LVTRFLGASWERNYDFENLNVCNCYWQWLMLTMEFLLKYHFFLCHVEGIVPLSFDC